MGPIIEGLTHAYADRMQWLKIGTRVQVWWNGRKRIGTVVADNPGDGFPYVVEFDGGARYCYGAPELEPAPLPEAPGA